MTICGARHPDLDIECRLSRGTHEMHLGYADGPVNWPNEDWLEPKSPQKVVRDLSVDFSKVRPDMDLPIEPGRGTRRAEVLEYLRGHPGQWVPGWEMSNSQVGGTEGLRRLRELREAGHPIEVREEAGDFYYRLEEA